MTLSPKTHRRSAGFTLVEMIGVLSVIQKGRVKYVVSSGLATVHNYVAHK